MQLSFQRNRIIEIEVRDSVFRLSVKDSGIGTG